MDCAKYLSTQTGVEEGSSGMVSVLTNHKINSPDISIRVKQVITTAQQEGMLKYCNKCDVKSQAVTLVQGRLPRVAILRACPNMTPAVEQEVKTLTLTLAEML